LKKLEGHQRKYLRGLAHSMKPVVFIGQKGYSDTVINAIDSALTRHELIKIKFIDFKDKAQKDEILGEIVENSKCENVGMIGHTAILYLEHNEPEKRKITLPKRKKSNFSSVRPTAVCLEILGRFIFFVAIFRYFFQPRMERTILGS